MKLSKLVKKFQRVWKEEGKLEAVRRSFHFMGNVEGRRSRRIDAHNARITKGNVLFINGCCVEHPTRYRVFHQMEQLENAGITCAKVYFEDIDLSMEENYELFIFYRCECTEDVEKFIKKAQSDNKKVFFDIDDLVTDVKYTDQIPFVQELSPLNKKLFDNSVMQMGKTMRLCDSLITTTTALAEELGKEVAHTYINRNTVSKEMIECAESAYQEYKKDSDKIKLGYFSGSLTHNKDFEVIRPALTRILREYPNVELLLVGELAASDELNEFSGRVKKLETTNWRELPKLIVQADINLAPLEDTLFNRAKSELKWFEAALVRVPTVASAIGAFAEMVEDWRTGVLSDNDTETWYEGLKRLIDNASLRENIGAAAYEVVIAQCTTASITEEYMKFLFS